MKTVPLVGKRGAGFFAIVDDEDYERISASHWYASTPNKKGTFYAVRKPYRASMIGMHREVMGLEKGDPRQVDHRNHDKLDNRRANLRVGTRSENAQNLRPRVGTTSSYRGVSWSSLHSRWRARITVAGHVIYLGHFVNELDAARVTREARLEHMAFAVEEPTS